MPECPTDFTFAAFVDGSLSPAQSREIRMHAVRCPACAQLLLDLIVLRHAEVQAVVGPLSEAEVASMRSAIRAALRKTATGPAQSPAKPGLADGIRSTLGVVLGGEVLIEGLRKVLGGAQPTPALGHRDEKKRKDGVRNHPESGSLIHEATSHPDPNSMNAGLHYPTTHHAPSVIGLPGVQGQSPRIQQAYSDTCAIRSQELLLRDFGIQISETDLRHEAAAHGWYAHGTPTPDVGNLLELHGVHVHKYLDANIFTLTGELAQGHKVIIGVNSSELWHHGPMQEILHNLGLSGADHALIVSGIDTSDPDHVRVVLTDPGSGDIAKSYPMDQFIHAWKDSHCFMVATDQPAPPWLPEMAHFDYGLGHVEMVGNISYEDFSSRLADASNHSPDPLHDPAHPGFNSLFDTIFHGIGHEPQSPENPVSGAADGGHPHDHHHSHDAAPHHEPTIHELVDEHLHPSDDHHHIASSDFLSDHHHVDDGNIPDDSASHGYLDETDSHTDDDSSPDHHAS